MEFIWFCRPDFAALPFLEECFFESKSTSDLPSPAREFIIDHFTQSVLKNMRVDYVPSNVDFEPEYWPGAGNESQNHLFEEDITRETFLSGDGKGWLERFIAERLVPGLDDSDEAADNFDAVRAWLEHRNDAIDCVYWKVSSLVILISSQDAAWDMDETEAKEPEVVPPRLPFPQPSLLPNLSADILSV